jgi:hypothetical protein
MRFFSTFDAQGMQYRSRQCIPHHQMTVVIQFPLQNILVPSRLDAMFSFDAILMTTSH